MFGDNSGMGSAKNYGGKSSPSPKIPEIRGWGRGYTSLQVRGHFGDSKNFGDFFGENPRKTSNFGVGTGATVSGDLGDTSGTGTVQNFGDFQRIFGESPKIPESVQIAS